MVDFGRGNGPPVQQDPGLRDVLAAVEHLHKRLDGMESLLGAYTKPFLTTDEVASQAGVTEYTVRRWIKRGRLEAIRIEGSGPRGRLLVPRSELMKLHRPSVPGDGCSDRGVAQTDCPPGVEPERGGVAP